MNELKANIQKLLQQTLVLKKTTVITIESRLDSLNQQQLERVFEILTFVDEKQTKAMQSLLEKKPYFFHELENKLLSTIKQTFFEIESKQKSSADATLAKDLKTLNS